MPASAKTPLGTLIRKLSVAERFSDAERRAIEGLPHTVRTIAARQDVVHEGGPSRHCCIVLDGWTCCYQTFDAGRRQILSIHVPGELPDLQSLYLPDTDFGMAALTAATVAVVPHGELRRLIADHPRIAAALWRETLVAAAIHRAWMAALGRRDARGRLAHIFCELCLRLSAVGLSDGTTFPLPLTQPDLADALGMTSVHVNRVLQDLRGAGVIDLQGRRLTIRDWPRLRTVAEFSPRYLHLAAPGHASA